MINYWLNQLAFAGFNLLNSRLDAYRILKHKTIAHWVNFGLYGILYVFFVWRQSLVWTEALILGLSALFQRQLTFDIPLNLRRGLEAFYQSTAERPKAWWDRMERKIFGKASGKTIAIIYAVLWAVMTVIQIIFFH